MPVPTAPPRQHTPSPDDSRQSSTPPSAPKPQ
jgi:hypothetical protein